MGSIARMNPKHPKVVGTCPGHHPRPIGQNRVFEITRPCVKYKVTRNSNLSCMSITRVAQLRCQSVTNTLETSQQTPVCRYTRPRGRRQDSGDPSTIPLGLARRYSQIIS